MHKKFEVNRTKIKGGCQSGRKVVPKDSTAVKQVHMHKKFEVNQTKIKGGCQSYTKAEPWKS